MRHVALCGQLFHLAQQAEALRAAAQARIRAGQSGEHVGLTELRNGSSGFAGSEPLAHAPAARRTNIFREELGKALSCSDDEEESDIPELEQFDDAVGDTEDDEDEDE